MAKNFETGLIITGNSKGGVRAVRATRKEIDGLSQGFDRGGKRAQDFAQRSQGVSRELQAMRRLAAPVGAAIAGMFAVNGLRNQIDFADQLQKTNLRIGASTEALSQYNHVAGLAGVQFNELTTAWQRQSRRVAQAAKDTGEAQEALATLNLDAAELSQLAPEEQFERIAGAMGGVANEAQRVALAQKIWDSEGVKLLQIVNQGTDAIRAQREEADRLGLTISQDTANAMASFNDEVTQLQAVTEGLSRQILADLVPSMTRGMQAASAWIDEMGGAESILDTTKTTVGGLAALMAGRYAGALAASTTEMVAKTRASIADAKAEASAAQAVTRRTGAELASAKAVLSSARLEEQATRGTSAHAFALQQLSAARVRATEAAAAHTSATNASSAAMGRASVAARGLSGAMTLVGGPLGLLVGGAGLLYVFRDELNLTGQRLGLTEEQVSDFQDELDDMSNKDMSGSLASLNAELREAALTAAAAREELAKLQQQDDGYSVTGIGNLGDQTKGIDAVAEAKQNLAKIEQKRNMARVELWGRWSDAVVNATDAVDDNTESNNGNAESVTKQAAAASELNKELKSQASELDSLRKRLDPAYAASQRLAESTAILDRGLASGALTLNEYLNLWDKAAETFIEARNSSDEATDDINDNTDEMATLWERRLERMDDAAVDMWGSFLDGSEDAFSSFKRLAIDTLAEVIHAYTTQRITANIGANFGIGGGQGGLGGSGGGFGGIPGLGTAANKAAGWLGLGGSSVGAAGTAAIGYGSGFGAAASTGAYTGWAGSATAGAASSGGIMSGIGAAMPWVGGGLLVDQVLDLGIVDGIVGGISSALGISGKYAGENPTGLIATRNQYGQAGRSGWERDAFATGALGDIGFAPDSRDIDTLFGDRDNFENAKAYAEQLAQLDNTVAQLAESEAELNAMRETAADQGLTNMSDIEGRYTAILGTLDGEFGEFVQGLDGSIEEVVQRGVAARQAFTLLSDAAERLDLRFDDTTASAYEAASSLAEMAGGTQQLTSLQQNYYQTLYSEEERLNQLRSDVTQQLNAMGMSLPRSRDGFRELVEAQDLNTEAGQRNYTQLLQLVDSFDRLADSGALVNAEVAKLDDQIASLKDDVKSAWETFDKQSFDQRISLLELAGESEQALALQRERELKAMDASLRPFQERFWALQDEAKAQEEAAQAGREYAEALASARDSLGSTFDNISSYLDQLRSTDKGGGTPREQLVAARSAFNEQLQLARSGDRTALQNITQYADRLIDAQRGWSASGGATASIIERIENQLGNLPDQVSAEQYIADEIKQALIEQTAGITSQLADVLRSDTPSNIAQQLAGSFDDLTRGIGDVLTREQLAIVMDGKASDAQLDAVMRAVDLNGDGVMSGLESVIIKSMPTDATLANALQNQLEANGNKALTAAQVRDALSPVASKAVINRLINRADRNADGIISAEELAASKISSGVISTLQDEMQALGKQQLTTAQVRAALSGTMSRDDADALISAIDTNGDGIVTANEVSAAKTRNGLIGTLQGQFGDLGERVLTAAQVRQALRPIASDERINQLIGRVDVNGDGLLSAQEITSARIGGLSGSIAQSLSGYFDELDANLDGKLTFEELREGLGGLATDAQLRAMMQSMDIDMDGVISGLESVIISEMPTDARLTNVLRNQMERSRNQSLSYAEVREALSPIASKAVINRLINKADRNADGVITAQELNSLRIGELTDSVISTLDASFDQLDANLDGKLTFAELRDGLDGMATNSQLRAMMRASDINANGVISGLEAVVIKSMPTDARLTNVLRNQLERSRNQSLSYSEVREALNPIASKTVINRLINRADVNADGIITAQELANARLDGLSSGIGGALSPMFDTIDSSLDGLINYDEFGKQFSGMASDKQLKRIFDQLDVNGDGTISRLESLKHSSDEVGDNTKSIEERALDQVSKLGDLVTDMTASTNQLVSLDSSVSDLAGVIGELNALQQQRAQEERQHERKMAQMAYYNTRQAAGENLIEQMETNQSEMASARESLNQNQVEQLAGFVQSNQAQGPTAGMDQEDWERIRDNIQSNDNMSRAAKEFVLNMAAYRLRRGRLNEWEAIVGGHEFSPDSLELSGYAQGGYTGPGNKYDVAGLVHAGEVVWSQSDVARAGGVGAVESLRQHGLDMSAPSVSAPPIPSLPLLGQSDVYEVLNDMRQELAALRAENKRLLGENNQHAAAGVRVNQTGFQQQIGATERGNKSLRKIQDRERMKELAR